MTTQRLPGMSVRLKLTLSYAGFLMVAGVLLVAIVWVFLLRGLPDVTTSAVGILNFRATINHAYLPATAGALAVLLVFGLAGGWLLAGRMLAPLSHITGATRLAATGSLRHRIRLSGRNDEFRELADAFDTMLSRLEAHVAEQRRFAANASHELRTPLAVTRTLLDVAQQDPQHDNVELLDRLSSVNARAIALTEALLLLSRADQRSFTQERVDLSLIADEVTETMLPLAEARGITLRTSASPANAVGSSALLLQLAMTLVHNGIVHNLPACGDVAITTTTDAGRALLVVESSGERLDPRTVATLVEPFRRGTERIRSDDGGVGLGLAIADSIVRAHDGTLALAARADGGLLVTVRLPAAAAT